MRAVPSVFSIKLFLWFISELFNKKSGINSSSKSASELCQTAGKQRVSSQVCVLLITFVYYFFLLLILLSAKWKNTSLVADGSKSYQPATGKASVQCLSPWKTEQTNERTPFDLLPLPLPWKHGCTRHPTYHNPQVWLVVPSPETKLTFREYSNPHQQWRNNNSCHNKKSTIIFN